MTAALAAAFAVFAVLPLGVLAAVPRLHDRGSFAVHFDDSLIPVASDAELRATTAARHVRLRWRDETSEAAAGFYRVLRAKVGKPYEGLYCSGRQNESADNCSLFMPSLGTTSATSFLDRPPPGTWTYRIGVAANWLDDPNLGDVYVVSKPVTVTVR